MLLETMSKIQDASDNGAELEYYSLEPRQRRMRFLAPCLYIIVGLIIGYVFATVGRPEDAAPQFRWVKVPLKRLSRGSHAQQLYDATQVEKFVNLRKQIDDDFNTQLNAVDTPIALDYDPFRLSLELLDRIDQDFDRFFKDLVENEPTETKLPWFRPEFTVEDGDAQVTVTCKLPDVDPEDLSIDLRGQQLSISASSRKEDEGSQYESHFSRTFIMPEGVQAKDVLATWEGDVLRVVVAKPDVTKASAAEPIVIQRQEAEL